MSRTEERASIELEKLDVDYRNSPYEKLPQEGDKRIYLAGQQVWGRTRVKLLINNDYVLTDDKGRYIDTEEVLTREYLMSLTQEQIQGTKYRQWAWLPIPRAEAIYRKLKPIKDKNNIAQYRREKQ